MSGEKINVKSYQPSQKPKGKSKSRIHYKEYFQNESLANDPYNLFKKDVNFDTVDVGRINSSRNRMPDLNLNYSHFTIGSINKNNNLSRYSRNNFSTSRHNASVVNLNQKLITPKVKNSIWIDKVSPSENKRREILKSLKMINSKLDPRFKLSKIDIEEIKNTKFTNKWNKPINDELLMKTKKQQRRKEYWNHRVLPPDSGVYISKNNLC